MSGSITLMVFFCFILFLCLSWFIIVFFKMSFRLLMFAFGLVLFLIICCCVSVDAHEYTPEDVVSIGKIVQHECPHESELGQRLVVDTILNRVESDEFPNTVREVLNQPGQYCNPEKFPPNDVYKLVAEEIYMRTNDRVLWYRTKKYHTYGEPVCIEGSHYFSGR